MISLEELSGQRKVLAEQRRLTEQQQERQLRLREQKLRAEEALAGLAASANASAPDCKLPISPSGRPS